MPERQCKVHLHGEDASHSVEAAARSISSLADPNTPPSPEAAMHQFCSPAAGRPDGARDRGSGSHADRVRPRRSTRAGYSLGIAVIATLAVLSSAAVLLWPRPKRQGIEFWTFTQTHEIAYRPLVDAWNRDNPDTAVHMLLLSGQALERRMLSAFRSDTPVADIMEVERTQVVQAFAGPLKDVGFVDLTDRLRAEGLDEAINGPSFSPWTSRGRIFGIPHDVHPVALAYRADIVEAAGIDVSRIHTWDDFERDFAPLMAERGPDGRPVRYLLNFWETNGDYIQMMFLQAGGAIFDDDEQPTLNTARNARILARLCTWVAGPSRIAVDAPEFNDGGNALRRQGIVLCNFMPDWLTGGYRKDLPSLSGKLKLMPLPAWEKGGSRTSVWGGTMLGIPKSSARFEDAFAFGLYLYSSPQLWDDFHRRTGIIPPIKTLWNRPVFSEPVEYFGGQQIARLYIELAPEVPRRPSTPFNVDGRNLASEALIALKRWAEQTGTFDRPALERQAAVILADKQAELVRRMNRNAFLRAPAATTP